MSQFNGILILRVNNHDLQLLTDAFKGKRLKEVIPGQLGKVSHDPPGWVQGDHPKQKATWEMLTHVLTPEEREITKDSWLVVITGNQ